MGSNASVKDILGELEKGSYISLLSDLISESQYVQNNPPDLVPQEDLVGAHVRGVLDPYSTENGGTLIIKQVNYTPGRGHLIIRYPGADSAKVVSFVGSHMDVVPADPSAWVFILLLLFFFILHVSICFNYNPFVCTYRHLTLSR